MRHEILKRIETLRDLTGARHPVGVAAMAGACPPALSAAVANAGGIGACGALLFGPDEIAGWARDFRAASDGPFIMNLWVPDPAPTRDAAHEAALRTSLSQWGPEVPADAGNAALQDFSTQVGAIIEARPMGFSSVMGLLPKEVVADLKAHGILWFATVTTTSEAKAAEQAGADIIVAQGAEAGGHRGAFEAENAERHATGLLALLPAIADSVTCPIIAAGGIADSRTAIAALILGASGVQIGTGLLRTPEAGINRAWADALVGLDADDTVLTRGFSGRTGRAIRTDYTRAIDAGEMPDPAPYPVQRGLTAAMRKDAAAKGDIQRMQAWAGQAARLSADRPAAEIIRSVADGIGEFLR